MWCCWLHVWFDIWKSAAASMTVLFFLQYSDKRWKDCSIGSRECNFAFENCTGHIFLKLVMVVSSWLDFVHVYLRQLLYSIKKLLLEKPLSLENDSCRKCDAIKEKAFILHKQIQVATITDVVYSTLCVFLSMYTLTLCWDSHSGNSWLNYRNIMPYLNSKLATKYKTSGPLFQLSFSNKISWSSTVMT